MERASRGFIKSWYDDGQPTLDKPNLDTVIEVFRNEPTVKAAIRSLVDEIIKNNYIIKASPTLKKAIEKELNDKYRFKQLLRKLVYNSMLYQNVFIEIVYKNNQPQEMHILETSQMEIYSDKHGEVSHYVQNKGDEHVTFSTEECIHISLDNVTSMLWGEVDMKTLYKTVALKNEIENFLVRQFKYNKFRDAYSIKNANDAQVKDFINQLKEGRDYPDRELVIDGDIEKIAGRQIDDLNTLVELLNYTRQQILTLLRVPPIIAGIPDNSNRSNSEVQARKAFDGRVLSIQRDISEEITNELFPKLGWKLAEFMFAPIDKRAEKDDIEIIKVLADMGLDDESLLQLIRDTGIQIRDGAKFEKPEPIIPKEDKEDKSGDEDMKDDASPVEHKTGEESETREDQLVGRSKAIQEGLDQYAEEVLNR